MRTRRQVCAVLGGAPAFALGACHDSTLVKPMRSPAAAEAERAPPSCISGFRHTAMPLARKALALGIDFKLGCQNCPNETFQISAFPLIAPDPSPYAELAPGETFNRPPHTLRCTRCATERLLFDARKHGYDAVVNDAAAYESGVEGVDAKAFIADHFKIIASFFYNIDLHELNDHAHRAKVTPSDLFDWVVISGSAADGADDLELSYECA